jgi:hypothetical protein
MNALFGRPSLCPYERTLSPRTRYYIFAVCRSFEATSRCSAPIFSAPQRITSAVPC